MTPERIINIAYTALSRNPALLVCDTVSMVKAVVLSSTLGLEPETPLGHAYLVPFRNNKTGKIEANFIIGYKGLADLMYRSGKVDSVEAHVVYDNDEFDFAFGSNSYIKHRPMLKGDRGNILCAYAIVYVKGSTKPVIEVVGETEINKARQASQSADSAYSPWVKFEAEMWKKTAVRRIAKLLPQSIENQNVAVAIEQDIKAEMGISQSLPPELASIESDEIENTEPVKSKTDKLADEIAQKSTDKENLTVPPSDSPPLPPEPEQKPKSKTKNNSKQITGRQADMLAKIAMQARKKEVITQGDYDAIIDEMPKLTMAEASIKIQQVKSMMDNEQ